MTEFLWPSDRARAESSELNRVCEYLEDVLDEMEAARAQQSGEGREPFAYHCVKGGQDCFSRTLREGDAAMWEMSGAVVTPLYKEESFVRPTCKGANCFAVDGVGHSPECKAEHEAAYTHPPKAQGVPEDIRCHLREAVRDLYPLDTWQIVKASREELKRFNDLRNLVVASLDLTTIPPADKPEGKCKACGGPGFRSAGDGKIGTWPCEFCERPAAPDMGGEK